VGAWWVLPAGGLKGDITVMADDMQLVLYIRVYYILQGAYIVKTHTSLLI
jgi:hypothetical protein